MTAATEGGRTPEPVAAGSNASESEMGAQAPAVFLDLDTVLLATYQGQRGIELAVQADLAEGIDRLSEVADRIVVLVYPGLEQPHQPLTAENRIETLRDGLGEAIAGLLIITCPHAGADCDCAKPGSGLINLAIEQHGLRTRGGWYVGADQEGVVAGRGAGLRTVRIGPPGDDHLSAVHRPDYEARDLLDAANHILVEELA